MQCYGPGGARAEQDTAPRSHTEGLGLDPVSVDRSQEPSDSRVEGTCVCVSCGGDCRTLQLMLQR